MKNLQGGAFSINPQTFFFKWKFDQTTAEVLFVVMDDGTFILDVYSIGIAVHSIELDKIVNRTIVETKSDLLHIIGWFTTRV
jgi:hypothetical protein